MGVGVILGIVNDDRAVVEIVSRSGAYFSEVREGKT